MLRIRGELDAAWSEWFDGLTVTVVDGTTLLTGRIADQAALHSLLARIRDLGLPLLSVRRELDDSGEKAGKPEL